MASSSLLSSSGKKVCLVVTGASRGLGRAIAVAFCNSSSHDETETICPNKINVHSVVLVARSQTGLQETAALMQEQQQQQAAVQKNISVPAMSPQLVVADLSDLTTLDATLDRILGYCTDVCNDDDDDHRLVFINNAGSLGHLGPCIDSPSLQDMQRSVDLNVTGALWTSVRVAQWAAATTRAKRNKLHVVPVTIVNISSLVAVQPFPTMAIYSAGKAARDSYHAAMAAENRTNNDDDDDDDAATTTTATATTVRILSYAPGPLETAMATALRSADALDESLKPHFANRLVDPMDSAARLLQLLQDDTFEQGAHIDYYDYISPTTDAAES
jgi:sepiapterin reductase